MSTGTDYAAFGLLYHGWARALSLLMALALTAVVLVLPQWVAKDSAALNHSQLSLSMLGISAGFIHGVGYVPVSRLWRWLFSPYLGWPVMLYSALAWLPVS